MLVLAYPGCKKALVMDGNMNNRRDVCTAHDAGCTEYRGLPGAIKTGCMNTPEHPSWTWSSTPKVTITAIGTKMEVCGELAKQDVSTKFILRCDNVGPLDRSTQLDLYNGSSWFRHFKNREQSTIITQKSAFNVGGFIQPSFVCNMLSQYDTDGFNDRQFLKEVESNGRHHGQGF